MRGAQVPDDQAPILDDAAGAQRKGLAGLSRNVLLLIFSGILLASCTIIWKCFFCQSPRVASFLVLGDWGYDNAIHGDIPNVGCQRAIADSMANKMQEVGDVNFVINVGDSFYPGGVDSKEDPQWDTKWRNIYSRELRSVPWYSVYGNHDYHKDPCACGDSPDECAQVNGNIANMDQFYMPSYSWFLDHADLGVEVIALDMNNYMNAWNKSSALEDFSFADCQYTPCEEKCIANSKSRSNQAFDLFYERIAKSTAASLLVFSHYPTDYFWGFPKFIETLSDASKFHIEFFGGHRHNVDQSSTIPTKPNNNWLVGGGGGWSCEHYSAIQQGFVVGEIRKDKSVNTYSVLVDPSVCCTA